MAKTRREAYGLWIETLFSVTMATPFVIINKDLKMRYFSTAFSNILGYGRREMAKLGFEKILIEGKEAMFDYVFRSDWRGELELQNFMFRHGDGSIRCFDAIIRRLKGWVIIIFKDVNRLAFDGLTRILNRQTFNLLSRAQIRIARRLKKKVTVFVIDIDNFKKINDTFGHREGDKILQIAAKALQTCFHRQTDLIGRIGGDEFCVAIVNGNVDAEKGKKCFIEMFKKFSRVQTGGRYEVGASVGYATYDFTLTKRHYPPLEELVKEADKSMYKEKHKENGYGVNLLKSPRKIKIKKGLNPEKRLSNMLEDLEEINGIDAQRGGDFFRDFWKETDETGLKS